MIDVVHAARMVGHDHHHLVLVLGMGDEPAPGNDGPAFQDLAKLSRHGSFLPHLLGGLFGRTGDLL
jgi:hypothetical protein